MPASAQSTLTRGRNNHPEFGPAARQELTSSINAMLADFLTLYVKTKSCHWHVSGPNFREHHAMFDEHAGQLHAAVDPLAERVRKLGGSTIASIGDAVRRQRLSSCDSSSLPSQHMLSALNDDNQQLLCYLREAHALCEEYGDVGSIGLLETLIDQAEQRIWHLDESGRVSS